MVLREGAFALDGGGEAADDQFLLAQALGLEPVAAACAAVRRVGALGDDALGVQRAGVAEDRDAVAGDVFADSQCLVAGRQQRGEEFFAFA